MAEPRIMIKSINKTSIIAPPDVLEPQLVMNIPPSKYFMVNLKICSYYLQERKIFVIIYYVQEDLI